MMKRQNALLPLLLALLVGSLLLPALPARAAQSAVQPPAGTHGTTFTFTITGLWDEEQVGIWLTDPNGSIWTINERVFTDVSGQASWTWTAPATAPGGIWEAHAEGFHSGDETIVPFVLNAPETPHETIPSSLVLPDAVGPPGRSFTFVGRGQFEPGEQVSSWFVLPDGTTVDVDMGISVDPSGQIYRVWQSPADAMPGQWVFRARGIKSRFTVNIPFEIVAEEPVIPPEERPYTPPPPASGVEPEHGPRGTTFAFTASGFTPGEQLGRWVVAPDGTEYHINPEQWVYADEKSGTYAWNWTAPPDALEGRWTMSILGKTSLLRWDIPFDVKDTVIVPPADTAIVITPQNSPAPLGTRFRFEGSGFLPGEQVLFWATDTNGFPHENAKTAEANEQGVALWSWEVDGDYPTGEWTMTVQGEVSRKEAQTTFVVTGPVAEAIGVTPASGTPGTTFSFAASGFWGQEKVDFWLTPPDDAIERYDQPRDVLLDTRTDETGNVSWEWTAPADIAGGTWRMTARGEVSRVERVVDLFIERENPLPPEYGVSPASGPPGTTFTFFANNIPTDRAAFWVTGPDGTVYTNPWDYRDWMLSQLETGQDRYEWTWTAPPDAQPGVWTIAIRNLSDRPRLDPTKMNDPEKREIEQRSYDEDRVASVQEARLYVIHVTVEP